MTLIRQIAEAFPWNEAPRYLIRDRDQVYGVAVRHRLRAMGIRDKPIAPRSPWQNGFAERLIGSIRRECVDHVVALGEAVNSISCNAALAGRGPNAIRSIETARVHHAHRRRSGSMAARGARAAAGDASSWVPKTFIRRGAKPHGRTPPSPPRALRHSRCVVEWSRHQS